MKNLNQKYNSMQVELLKNFNDVDGNCLKIKEIIESSEFENAKESLSVVLGKDENGKTIVSDLIKMNQCLVTGCTGSGKSVLLHNMIMSLVLKNSPEDVRLVLIDPKWVEFQVYNGLPHLITPNVISGVEKSICTLKWCENEMMKRQTTIYFAGCLSIEEYNELDAVKNGKLKKMPYIVIMIDELAEIMVSHDEVMQKMISNLLKFGRCSGVHLVCATQRPSSDVLTNALTNNMATKISFKTVSAIDSRNVLGFFGAESLDKLGLAIMNPAYSEPMKFQTAYVSYKEIQNVVDFIKGNNEISFDESIEKEINLIKNDLAEIWGMKFNTKEDDLFKNAVKFSIISGKTSTSMLQKKFAIGYTRAAKLIDCMEDKGYISGAEGAKYRNVYITLEQFKRDFGEIIKFD